LNANLSLGPMSCPSVRTSLTATQQQNAKRSGSIYWYIVSWSHDFILEVFAMKEVGTFKVHFSAFLLEVIKTTLLTRKHHDVAFINRKSMGNNMGERCL
jgi:hypothetical protein